jgi:hypothetical protein
LAGYTPGRVFAPTVIVVIPCSGDECNPVDWGEWLPRRCPACLQNGVVGHGRRERSAHDREHDRIRVRRGRCKRCGSTLTVLPAQCIHRAPYSLAARQDAIQRIGAGIPVEQAAPDCLEQDRIADPSTLRRWSWLRIRSLVFLFCRWPFTLNCIPTIVAWDWRAAARILMPEPNPL